MARDKNGWIKLYRQIQNSEFYKEPRKFSKNEAWIDILLRTYHEDTTDIYKKKEIEIKKGTFPTSYGELAKAWGWNKKSVHHFLKELVQLKMITVEGNDFGNEKVTEKVTESEFLPITEKEDKKFKKKYADFVSMTEEEHQKLVEQFGEQGTKERIENLNLYKGSTGKTYKSDYMTILSWERKDGKKQKSSPVQQALDKMM